jgi:hypothetical protein
MERRDSEYRGWKLCVKPGRPSLGHGVRGESPHQVILAKGWGAGLVLKNLRRQIDEFEDGGRCGPSETASDCGE